jgi:hypothetical protein
VVWGQAFALAETEVRDAETDRLIARLEKAQRVREDRVGRTFPGNGLVDIDCRHSNAEVYSEYEGDPIVCSECFLRVRTLGLPFPGMKRG